MSMDKSLRRRGGLVRARNVLKRSERLDKLKEQERWQEGQSPFGLPKVRVYRLVAKKTKKTKKEDESAAGGDAKAPAAKGKEEKKK